MKSSTALVHCTIYTGDTVLRDHALILENGRIRGTVKPSELPPETEQIDLGGQKVAAGFIDIQVNGGGGVLFNDDPSPATLSRMAKAHERFGTLHMCPTVITTDLATMQSAISAVSLAKETNPNILGVHLEGPFLSQKRPGVHDPNFIRKASDDEITQILAAGKRHISLMTLAPESVSDAQMDRLVGSDIVIFLGHTNAACDEALEAFRRGARGVTHLFNAMSQMTGREPGVVGASLQHLQSWAGIIADGFHVDYRNISIAKTMKNDRLILVTDAMPPVGSPDQTFKLGQRTIVCENGRCATAEGTLAGSALDMASAVRNCTKFCGIPLEEALRMASLYPAKMLGLDDNLGSIHQGKIADLVIFDDDIMVNGIVKAGVVELFS